MIDAARGCAGIPLHAPITAGVVAALPDLGIVSRIGAGFDMVDVDAWWRPVLWVANSPDHGIGEVATHALSLALASLRNVVRYDRDIRGGRWSYLSGGAPRPAEPTLGIRLGIGKRMAHVSRNVFRQVIAYDPVADRRGLPPACRRARPRSRRAGEADLASLHTPPRRNDPGHDREPILRCGEAWADARQHVAGRGGRHRGFARRARCWNTARRRARRPARGTGARIPGRCGSACHPDAAARRFIPSRRRRNLRRRPRRTS